MRSARSLLPWLCLPLLFAGKLAAQSPWTQSKAGFFVQAAWQFIPTYDALFDPDAPNGRRDLPRSISEHTLQLYGEYGINAKTTVVLALPFRYVRAGAPTGKAQADYPGGWLASLGNTSLAVRRSFGGPKWAFSGQLRVDAPAVSENFQVGLLSGFRGATLLGTLSVGRGYGNLYWFAYGGFGVRESFDRELSQAGFETGIKWRKSWLIAFTEHFWSYGPEDAPGANRSTGLFLLNQSYWSYGLKTVLAFNRFTGATLSGAGAFRGKNVARQYAFSLGAYFKWD